MPLSVRVALTPPSMLRVAQLVRAPGCGPGGQRFEPAHAPHGRMPESGQKGRTVNSLASAYVGSNPTSPTII